MKIVSCYLKNLVTGTSSAILDHYILYSNFLTKCLVVLNKISARQIKKMADMAASYGQTQLLLDAHANQVSSEKMGEHCYLVLV